MDLSFQVKKWIQNASLNNTRRSKKLVESDARSLAHNLITREEVKNALLGPNNTPILQYAAKNGFEDLFNYLIEVFQVDVNFRDLPQGITVAHVLASAGRKKLLEKIIRNYACDFNVVDSCNATPLCFSIIHRKSNVLQMLLSYGAAVNIESYLGKAVHCAAYAENIEALKMMTKEDPNAVNEVSLGFVTPLVIASLSDSRELFLHLTEIADVHASPLFYKVICNSQSEEFCLERIGILLNLQLDPNLYDQDMLMEELPILCAAKRGWVNVVNSLFDHTTEIPEVPDWSANGLIEFVNSQEFKTTNVPQRVNRVDSLRARLIAELRERHYLAANLICESLKLDMDEQEWDYLHSICSFLIRYGGSSMAIDIEVGNIATVASVMLHEHDEELALLAAKSCMALDPRDEISTNTLFQVNSVINENRQAAQARGRAARGRAARGSRRRN